VTTATAGFGILRLNDYADQRGDARLQLRDIDAHAQKQSALEWEAVAERGLSSDLADELRTVQDQMAASMAALGDLDRGSRQVGEVRAVLGVYQAAVADEFDLLAHSDFAEAGEVDDQRVDPAFDRLAETLAEANARYGAAARSATRTADLGTILLLVVAASVIGLRRIVAGGFRASEPPGRLSVAEGRRGVAEQNLGRVCSRRGIVVINGGHKSACGRRALVVRRRCGGLRREEAL